MKNATKRAAKKAAATPTTETEPQEQAQRPAPTAPVVLMLDPAEIEQNGKHNYVRAFDPADLEYQDLKLRIEKAGKAFGRVGHIYEPIAVTEKDGKYSVERGFQRLSIAVGLNRSAAVKKNPELKMLIPVMVETGPTDLKSVIERQLAENTKTNMSAIDRARTALQLERHYDGSDGRPVWNQQQIADYMHVTQASVAGWLSVMKRCDKPTIKAIHEGKMNFSEGLKIARLKDKEEREQIAAKARAEAEKAAAEKAAKRTTTKTATKTVAKKAAATKTAAANENITEETPATETKPERQVPTVSVAEAALAGQRERLASEGNAAAAKAQRQVKVKPAVTAAQMLEDVPSELCGGAYGKTAVSIGRAIERYIKSGRVKQLGEEIQEIENEIRTS